MCPATSGVVTARAGGRVEEQEADTYRLVVRLELTESSLLAHADRASTMSTLCGTALTVSVNHVCN